MKGKIILWLREILGFALLGFKIFIPSKKFNILSIYFHDPTPRLLERVIRHLKSNDYKIVSLNYFNEVLENKQDEGKIAVITFDDGWKNNFQLVEVIKKYNVPVAFFITTSAIEVGNFWFEFVEKGNKRKKEQIKKLGEEFFNQVVDGLKAGKVLSRSALTKDELVQMCKNPMITIGSHTLTHPILPNCSTVVRERELIDSKLLLEKWTKKQVKYFSYPNGNYTESLKEMARLTGYDLCFTTETTYINLEKVEKHSIPRMCINDHGGYFEALSKIYGIWQRVLGKLPV